MVEMGRKENETVGETSRLPLLGSVLLNISCDLLHVVWCNEQQGSLCISLICLWRREGGAYLLRAERFLCNTCQGYLPVAGTMPGIHRANRVYE